MGELRLARSGGGSVGLPEQMSTPAAHRDSQPDPHPATGAPVTASDVLRSVDPARSTTSLPPGSPAFLQWYRDTHLVPAEWPVILEAHRLADAGQARELVALDQAWGRRVGNGPFAEASLRVGQRQLNRLRPLADLPAVQRYLEAIAAGRAHGWHPVVYGVVLAVFSLPLRQGLIHYATRTLGGFGGGDTEAELPPDVLDPLVPALHRLLAPGAGPDAGLRVVPERS